MNKKQKVLTICALVVFVAIGACHYLDAGLYQTWSARNYPGTEDYSWHWETRWEPYVRVVDPKLKDLKGRPLALVPDVQLPWFMLGVIYTALFFLLQNKRGS